MKISEAIKWIDNRMCWGRGQWTEHHQLIIDEPWQAGRMAIEALQNSQWIPCSEKLPEFGQKVLASTKKTVFTQVFKGYYSEPNKWKWEHNSVKTIEAWMPLPTEYKGERR